MPSSLPMSSSTITPTVSPPQVVLIPGLAGDATMWQDQLRELAAWQPVVASPHTDPSSLRIEDMAALLLRQHPGRLILCGASMGGMVAMEAARQAPERVAGLALLGTTARPETSEMRQLREQAIALFEAGRVREVIEPNVAMAFHPLQAAQPALVQRYLEFVLGAGAEQLIRQNIAVIHRPDARLHLPRMTCPVLVLAGDADQLTPPDCAEEIARLTPGSSLHRIPECGHMLTMEKPDQVNALLNAWLQTIT